MVNIVDREDNIAQTAELAEDCYDYCLKITQNKFFNELDEKFQPLKNDLISLAGKLYYLTISINTDLLPVSKRKELIIEAISCGSQLKASIKLAHKYSKLATKRAVTFTGKVNSILNLLIEFSK